jgi:hypothetical protein
VDTGFAVVAGVVLAVVAFRRARGVLHPEARRAVTRQAIGTRARRALTVTLAVARAALGIAALVGVVWLTRRLFT